MSEYQYYEFRAIDRPLDAKAMSALRAITSRAEITPTSLINEYHYGDFKGDPDELMEEYFDAHLYVANWGTHQLMLRLPAKAFPLSAAEPYSAEDALRVWATKAHVILDFFSHSEDDYEWQEGDGWLASFIPLRSDLLNGDLRCLYLGWLAGIDGGEVEKDVTEPPVPPGLGQPSASLTEFASFLRVDPDLIEVAAATSASKVPTGPTAAELAPWVARLPEAEKNRLLVRVVEGEGIPLGAELAARFRSETAPRKGRAGDGPARRTVEELLAARDKLAGEKRRLAVERKAEVEARQAREREEARARHLDSLAGKEDDLWREVETAVGTKLPKQYDHAIGLLKDLRDLAERAGTTTAFAPRVRELRQRHARKSSFVERLDKAGLLK